ncbi:MAG: putative Ig domain-containing protein [Bacteroidetes bacterium]|nr:putative Ig domain-containing protein [Bacteroidota bacterium]
MKNIYTFLIALTFTVLSLKAQDVQPITNWKFHVGDNMQWKNPGFDDKLWQPIRVDIPWDDQGYKKNEGYGWYRAKFMLPSSLKDKSYLKDSIKIYIGPVDECDQTYLNGVLIGQNAGIITPNFEDPNYAWTKQRCYAVAVNDAAINWDKENVIAIRVYNGYGIGGMYQCKPEVSMRELIDYVKLFPENISFKQQDKNVFGVCIEVLNKYKPLKVNGKLVVQIKSCDLQKVFWEKQIDVSLTPFEMYKLNVDFPIIENSYLQYTFTESITKRAIQCRLEVPYILTPNTAKTPKINGAKAFGVRPGHPFLYKIAATGEKPLSYAAEGLPNGLKIDKTTGIIRGSIAEKGTYKVSLIAENSLGKNTRNFSIECGDLICLTPPLGWNSWNCWGLSVSTEKVKASADALISSGLIDHGWTYMNIDDGWELVHKGDSITCNEKFPDMKSLADYVHSKGIKLGIYSSPGPKTCGGYEGSFNYEQSDANNYAAWGIDYLKYDWCSYETVACNDTDRLFKPYRTMQKALSRVNRDIVYSLCQYGMGDVWKWGASVNGNTWRTTGDITDSWSSLSEIGFNQDKAAPYSQPGRWNDPDMLVVGKVGWGPSLHNTHLTPSEQYTHISLWALLSAPLLIGCDLSQLDDFTLNLLCNDEVIDIDQDPLGKGALRVVKNPDYQVWVKQLEDGSIAVGIFNLSDDFNRITVNWNELNIKGSKTLRDVWRQKDLGKYKDSFTTKVSSHGVLLLRIY